MNLNLLAGIAVGIGTLGQFCDSWTTFDGLYVKKVPGVVEGDSSATWITKNKWTCLLLKPLAFAACGVVLILTGPHTDDGGYIMACLLSAGATFVGVYQGFLNAKINGGWF